MKAPRTLRRNAVVIGYLLAICTATLVLQVVLLLKAR